MAEGSLEVRKQEIMAEYERAKADYERKKELADERIVSQKTFRKHWHLISRLRKNTVICRKTSLMANK